MPVDVECAWGCGVYLGMWGVLGGCGVYLGMWGVPGDMECACGCGVYLGMRGVPGVVRVLGDVECAWGV